MNKLIIISLGIILLASCSAEKKMIRRQNKAAKLVDRAAELDPNLIQERTELIPVNMKSTQVNAEIRHDLAIPLINERQGYELPISTRWKSSDPGSRDTIPAIVFPVEFHDDSLSARISLDGSELVLEYTIRPQPCDTVIEYKAPIIQPTKWKQMPLSWWQKFRMRMGELGLAILIILIVARIITAQLNKA